MPDPIVSVILPNYNHAAFLQQRIDSILSQSFSSFELIILDDCSTDDSVQLIEQYRSHPKVSQIVLNEQNSGSTFLQWQKGIALAKGSLIWIAESDDWCEPTLLAELATPMLQQVDIVLSYCQLLCVTDGRISWQTHADAMSTIFNGITYNQQKMLGTSNLPNASAILFKKDVFNSIPLNYTALKYCGDWMVWTSIIRKGKVYESGKVLNYFRKHGSDVSGKATVNGLDFTEGLQIFKQIVSEDLPNAAAIQRGIEKLLARYKLLQSSITDPSIKKEIEQNIHQLATSMGIKTALSPKRKFRSFFNK